MDHTDHLSCVRVAVGFVFGLLAPARCLSMAMLMVDGLIVCWIRRLLFSERDVRLSVMISVDRCLLALFPRQMIDGCDGGGVASLAGGLRGRLLLRRA
jgi:hypothetical protein